MADRSPNYPSMSLGEAAEAIKKVHAAEGRSKAPRLSIVKPLGYTSINGRSLSILGALKAYGLIEGRGDEVRISQEGFVLANAPLGSVEYREALIASFRAPAAFQQFTEEDESASADTLKSKLQKAGFQSDSAERLVRIYRDSRDLVNSVGEAYQPPQALGEEAAEESKRALRVGDAVRWESSGVIQFEDRQLLGVSSDGDWGFVEGSKTGVPMSELQTVERAASARAAAPPLTPLELLRAGSGAAKSASEPDFIVKLGDGRIAVIEIKGGEAEARHLSKLARFIKLQEELLMEDDIDAVPIEDDLRA